MAGPSDAGRGNRRRTAGWGADEAAPQEAGPSGPVRYCLALVTKSVV